MCENENSVKLYINEFPVYMYMTKCWRSGHTLACSCFFCFNCKFVAVTKQKQISAKYKFD